jgi:hypothetical protein
VIVLYVGTVYAELSFRLICVAQTDILLEARRSTPVTSRPPSPALRAGMCVADMVEAEQQHDDVSALSPELSQDSTFVHDSPVGLHSSP